MNRKKINSIIAVMSTVLTVNLGGSINVQALEMDKDTPSLQEHQNSDGNQNVTEILNPEKNDENEASAVSEEADDTAADSEDAEANEEENTTNSESDNTLDTADTNAADMETSNSSNTSSTDDSQPNESVDTDKSDFPVSEPANDKINETNTEAVNMGANKLEANAEKRLEQDEALDEEEISAEEMVQSYNGSYDDSVKAICNGTAGTSDYMTALGVNVKARHLETVNNAEKDAAKAAGGTLDEDTMQDVLDNALATYNFLLSVNRGTAQLNDYINFGLSNVTQENIADVTLILMNRPSLRDDADDDVIDFYTKEQIQAYIDAGLNSINLICTGKAGLADYENIAVTNLKEDDLLEINEGLNETACGKVLTIAQIKEAVIVELNKIAIITKINDASELMGDFGTLGITNVTSENFDYIKEALKGKGLKTVSQVRAAVEDANKVVIAIKNICSKNCTIDDYIIVGLAGEDSVTEGNINFINEHMDVEYKGYSSLADIKESVTKSLDLIKLQLIKKVTDGTAEVSDYQQLGALRVTKDNKDFINSKLKGTEYQTIPDVLTAVEKALNTLKSIENINLGNGTTADYDAVNASGVTDANLRFVDNQLDGHKGYDEEEIRNKVTEAVKLFDIYERIDKGNAQPEDYIYIGVSNVTNDNITEVNNLVQGKHYTTASEINDVINSEFSRAYAIKKIKNGTAELDDYMIVEITGVDATNYKYINSQIVGKDCSSKDSIQKAVDDILALYAAMKQINLGLGKAEDYKLVQVADVNENNMNFVNGYVKGSNDFELTSLQKKIENAVKVYNTIEFIKTGNAKLEDYQFLAIVDVNEKNYEEINKALKGSDVTSVKQIQDKVNEIVNNKSAKQRVEDGTASVADYDLLGIKNITLKNITFVNEQVDGTTYADVAAIQTAVNKAVDLYNEVVDINDGKGTLQEYKDVDADTKVTSQNMDYVADYIVANKDYNLKRLINNINTAVSQYDAICTIKRGGADVPDYRTIDIYDVNLSNLDYVNKYIAKNAGTNIKLEATESQLLLKKKIENEVTKAITIFDAICRVNAGTASVNDYIDVLQISDIKDKVNDQNIDYINFKLKGQNLTNEDSITDEINKAVSEFGAITRINEGIATTGDYKAVYEQLGPDVKSPVDQDNITYINPLIKGKEYTTPSSIKAFVDKCIEKYAAIQRINAGKGLLSDYNLLGLKEVTETNLIYVNERLVNQEITTDADLKGQVKTAVLCYEAIERIKQGSGTAGDYDLLKVTGVTEENIDFINKQLKDGNFENEIELQDAIDEACNVSNSVKRINAGDALPADYNSVGTKAVNSNNIIFVNGALKGRNLESPAMIKVEAELAAKEFEAISRIDRGNGTLEDYETLGIAGVLDGNLAYVNEGLKDVILRYSTTGLEYFVMAKVIEEGNTYVNSFSVLNKINAGTAKLSEYKSIGIDAVTNENIQFINTNIKGFDLKTIAEVEDKANALADDYAAVSRINQGIAKLSDFVELDIDGVTESTLIYVNADLNGKNLLTTKDIQTMINTNKDIYAALSNINLGKGTVEDYKKIGSVSITEDKLDFVNYYITTKDKKLTALDERRNVENILAADGAFGRINNGKGTLDDYEAVGATGVKEENINYINSEIYKAINPYGTNLDTVIKEILAAYDTAEAINNSKETYDTNKNNNSKYVKEYYEISKKVVPFDLNGGSQFRTIQQCVQIYRKILNDSKLNKEQIKTIITQVVSYPEDAKYVIGKLTEQLEAAANNAKRDLNSEETKSIADNLIANIKQTVSRVSVGEGTVEDFNFLGQYDVLDKNINIINRDIKKHNTIGTTLSQYRLNPTNLKNAVATGLAIKNINDESGKLSDYTLIGCTKMGDNATANTKNSLFQLVNKAIKIQRQLNDYTDLDRNDILNLIDEVDKSKDDAIELLDIITTELNENINLTGEEKKQLINDLTAKRKDVVARVESGYGTVEDFEYLGKREVKSENLSCVNTEIKENPNVTKGGDYRINGLDEAIKRGIAIYSINTCADTAAVTQFSKLGLTVEYSSQEGSKFNIIETQIDLEKRAKNGEYLTGSEIAEIVNDVNNNYEDRKVILVEIQDLISSEEQETHQQLTAERIKEIMDSVESNIKGICTRVYKGLGTVEDFKYLGETVTDEVLKVINTDIKAHQTITLVSPYRVDKVTEAVELGKAIYGINTKTDESIKKDYERLNLKMDFDNVDAAKFNLVKMEVELERKRNDDRLLTRNEIFQAVKDVENDFEDMQVLLPQINEAINDEERRSGTVLTSDRAKEIVEEVKTNIKGICERVSEGKGKVEDFKALGKNGVTSNNIDVINRDIKQYKGISVVSSYRLENLDKALEQAMAVYKINTSNDKSLENCFKALDLTVPYETGDQSKFKLIISQIKIQKLIAKDYLDRKAISDIVNNLNIEVNYQDEKAIIPKVNEAVTDDMTPEEVQNKIDEIKNSIKDVCQKIINGEGTADDYNYLGESRVTKDNIYVVNKDIKENGGISLLTNYTIDGLDDAVTKGLAVYKINNDTNKTVTEAFKALDADVEYSTDKKSKFSIITSQIAIKRKLNKDEPLNRKQVLEIVKYVEDNFDDQQMILPIVSEKIKEKEKETETPITAEQVNQIMTDVQNTTKEVCKRIVNGEGTVADYQYFEKTEVNSENIDSINKDIKLNGTVTASSSYRLGGLDEAVTAGLAVYNINNNDNDDVTGNDFKTLGIDVSSEDGSTRKLKIVELEVILNRQIQGRDLTRSEIKNIVTYVNNNLYDEEVIIPKVNEELIKKGKDLTGEDVTNIINSVKDNMESVCKRVLIGEGTLEDYAYLGEVRVNADNLGVVNKDIYYYKNVTLLSNYRLKGLDDAVTNALSVYKINNATENSAMEDFSDIGIELEYSTDEQSLFKLIQTGIKIARREQDNKYLSRQEIKDIVTDIQDHRQDAELLIPILNTAINTKEKAAGKKLTGEEVIKVVNETLENCKQVLVRIYCGEATVEDYVAVGENRITAKNIDIANAEQKEFRTITKASDYRLNDITKAVDCMVDIYDINLGAEYEKHDEKVIKDNYGNVIRKYNTNYRVKQYEDFGYNVAWDNAANSEFTLIKDQVRILRALKEGKYLTRNEIISDVINKIHNSLDDSKIIIPRIFNAINDAQTVKCGTLKTSEAQEVIDTETAKMKNAVDRIVAGGGTVEDYNYLGMIKVTKENVGVINTDVKLYRTIRELSDVRVTGLEDGVNLGLAVYDINRGIISKDANEYALLGRNLEYDETKTSLFMLVQNYISIQRDLKGGELLNRDDILNAIDYVIANKEDMVILIPKIKSAIDEAKLQQVGNFTAENAKTICDQYKEKLSGAVNRVYNGNADVEDYVYIGETRVNEENKDTVNKDIRENREIVRLTNYRLGGLTEAVSKAVAVYTINIDGVTADADNNAKEYALLGRNVEYSYDSKSPVGLIQSYITLKKKLNYNKDLTRAEIISTIDEVLGNIDRYKILIPYVADEIFRQEQLNGKELSVEEVDAIYKDKQNTLQGAAKRIVVGAGTLNDYKLFGENRVTRKNLKVVNDDIYTANEISTTSPYSISGLTEAVNKGIAVYNLNENMDTKDTDGTVKELKALGENVKYSEDNLSIDKLLMKAIEIAKRINNDKPISRDTIIDMLYQIEDNLDLAKAKIPKIIVDIYEQDHIQGTTILGEDVRVIVNNNIETVEENKDKNTDDKGSEGTSQGSTSTEGTSEGSTETKGTEETSEGSTESEGTGEEEAAADNASSTNV